MKVTLRHPNGKVKQIKVGFSWTVLFFGFFPPLFRGDFKWAAIIFVIEVVTGVLSLGIGAWVTCIIFGFLYNKMNIKELLQKGFEPADQESAAILQQQEILPEIA